MILFLFPLLMMGMTPFSYQPNADLSHDNFNWYTCQ